MNQYKLIILNHFRGEPELMDDTCCAIRYATVLDIISEANPDDTIFVSNHDETGDKKLDSIKIVALSKGFKWINFKDESITEILYYLGPKDTFTPENTTIIVGGTNTAGCLLYNSNVSVSELVYFGYKVHMYLSMCGDYESPGVNSADNNSMAFARLYKFIKDNNMMDKVDIYYNSSSDNIW